MTASHQELTQAARANSSYRQKGPARQHAPALAHRPLQPPRGWSAAWPSPCVQGPQPQTVRPHGRAVHRQEGTMPGSLRPRPLAAPSLRQCRGCPRVLNLHRLTESNTCLVLVSGSAHLTTKKFITRGHRKDPATLRC